MKRQLRILIVLLALAATGVFVGLGAHGHADGSDHANCWLCIASHAAPALPVTSALPLLFWVIVARLIAGSADLSQVLSAPHTYPRAPPTRLPI